MCTCIHLPFILGILLHQPAHFKHVIKLLYKKRKKRCLVNVLIKKLIQLLTLFGEGGKGGGGFWCPRQLWVARNFRQFKIILSYHRTFPQIYLAVWWCGRILVMGSDVAMSTAFWRACFAEIWISCLFFTLNCIVMLEIEYFGHLEHYCFERMLSQIFSVDLWRHRWRHTDLGANCKIWEWRPNKLFLIFRIFSVPIFGLFGIF